jgi:endonuclease/exonuclease/phosphatase family metal-dependent hydrolase
MTAMALRSAWRATLRRVRGTAYGAPCLAMLALVLAAPSRADPMPSPGSSPSPPADAVTLRVMTFNVWYGGEQVSLAKVAEAIRIADADIVGLQEADCNLERIAAAAGMPFVDPRRRILSRWPIFDSGSGERTEQGASPYSITALDRDALHAWVMVRPGKVVAVSNVHLSNSPSGLGAARRGGALADVLAIENRTRALEAAPLAALGRLAAGGTPVFLTGDLNSASHLDWTEATSRVRDDVPYAVDWPATRLLSDAGLRDSYREVYPDPVARPGFTWTPGAPHPLAPSDRGRDRIDYVWTGGRSQTLSSQIVGEKDGPDVDIAVGPWPSDHRAVVSTFTVTPADAPALIVATPRRVTEGGNVFLRTWDPEGPAWTALITRHGAKPGDALTGVREMPHDYQRSIPLSTVGIAPGNYDAVLVGEDGRVLRRNAFTIVAANARPEIVAVQARLHAGEPIRARWRNAPGDLRDWIGIYKAGEVDVSQYLGFVYTEAAFEGEAIVPASEEHPSLAPGEYELRLLHDESYVVLASARFTVEQPRQSR